MYLANFCAKIGYNFSNVNLLQEAITHPSVSKGSTTTSNYERLEFLGDKILSSVIANFLIAKYKNEMEGALSKRLAYLVSGETLSKIALEVGINEVIIISKGEKNLGGNVNKRNLENSLEALIGAIYLDSSYQEVTRFILEKWSNYLNTNYEPPHDPVSKLQELVQMKTKKLPEYKTQKSGGTDHNPTFTAIVKIPSLHLEFSAEGKSKKEAQKEVAKITLEALLKTAS